MEIGHSQLYRDDVGAPPDISIPVGVRRNREHHEDN